MLSPLMTTGMNATSSFKLFMPAIPSHTYWKSGWLRYGKGPSLGVVGLEGEGVTGMERADSAAREMGVGA